MVTTKAGLPGIGPDKPSSGMTPTIKYNLKTMEYNSIVGVILKVDLVGLVPAKHSFGMTKRSFCVTRLTWLA